MIQKELNELRRRMAPGKNNITKIFGCYVNSGKEIVSYLEEAMGPMPEVEAEKYMSLLKKSLSGGLGKNLIDVVFSTQQVQSAPEHQRLMALRASCLKDGDAREAFYRSVIDSLEMGDSSYLILLACDTYDVPRRSKDDALLEDSETAFTYLVCAICPVKDGKPELGYFSGENEFHGYATNQIVSAPELGFLFPAFDDRTANIYNALFYSKNAKQLHQEFIDGVFHTEAPMSAGEQKEAFQAALTDALGEDCGFGVVQALHEQLRQKIVDHKENKEEQPLEITVKDVCGILQDSGIAENQVQAFEKQCSEAFGAGAALNPSNLIDSGKFEVANEQVKLSVDPELSYLVETRIIDGKRYFLIPADEGTSVNGLNVNIKK